MPRRRLIITKDFPYHVTARSNNKEWFYIPGPDAAKIFCEKLRNTSDKYGVLIHAFVLMNNHFHLILTSPHESLGEVMRHLMTEVSKHIQFVSKRINHVFGSRYKWSILDSAYGVAYVYKYVLRNPVRAGLCKSVSDYPFSSIGQSTAIWNPPLVEGIGALWRFVPRDHKSRIDWLNQPAVTEDEAIIRKGLKNQCFVFSKGNDARKQIQSLETSYGLGSGSIFHDRYLYGREGD